MASFDERAKRGIWQGKVLLGLFGALAVAAFVAQLTVFKASPTPHRRSKLTPPVVTYRIVVTPKEAANVLLEEEARYLASYNGKYLPVSATCTQVGKSTFTCTSKVLDTSTNSQSCGSSTFSAEQHGFSKPSFTSIPCQ